MEELSDNIVVQSRDIKLVPIEQIIPNKIIELSLSQGFIATIDELDYIKFNICDYKWFSQRYNGFNYPQAWCKKTKKRVKLHRLITPDFQCVDHISGNTLDNTRKNLRGCTLRENARNAKKAKHGTSSKYKGVSKQSENSYRARIRVDGVLIGLGSGSEIHCAHLYNNAAIKYFKEFARINNV